jgi:hypothetical protein
MPDPSAAQSIAQPINKGAVAVYQSKGQLIAANFLGGLAWGFGSVMGATILAAIVLILFKELGGLPLIGSYIDQITQSITTRR